MSTLAIEIDQTLQQLDSATAGRLERLVRDALVLVKPGDAVGQRDASIRFPFVYEAMPITGEDAAQAETVRPKVGTKTPAPVRWSADSFSAVDEAGMKDLGLP